MPLVSILYAVSSDLIKLSPNLKKLYVILSLRLYVMRQMLYLHRHNTYKSNVLLFCSCLPVRLPTVKNQLSFNINILWFWNMEVKSGQVMVVYTSLKHVALIESYLLKRNSISQIIKKCVSSISAGFTVVASELWCSILYYE